MHVSSRDFSDLPARVWISFYSRQRLPEQTPFFTVLAGAGIAADSPTVVTLQPQGGGSISSPGRPKGALGRRRKIRQALSRATLLRLGLEPPLTGLSRVVRPLPQGSEDSALGYELIRPIRGFGLKANMNDAGGTPNGVTLRRSVRCRGKARESSSVFPALLQPQSHTIGRDARDPRGQLPTSGRRLFLSVSVRVMLRSEDEGQG